MKKRKKERSKADRSLLLLDFIRLIIITCVAALLLQTFVARKMEVIGPSMYPTLEEGETVFINVASNFLGEIKRFDVVVARNVQTDELWVKRVIGLPNETVEFKQDKLYIDGVPMAQDFLDAQYMQQIKDELKQGSFTSDYVSDRLGEDEYLLVGDNRNSSLDSRNTAIGPFKRDQIIANGVFVVTPFSKARYVKNGN